MTWFPESIGPHYNYKEDEFHSKYSITYGKVIEKLIGMKPIVLNRNEAYRNSFQSFNII